MRRSIAFFAVFAALLPGVGCKPMHIPFDQHEATLRPRAEGDVPLLIIACDEPTRNLGDCTHEGERPTWRVIGAFHVPVLAARRWRRFQGDLRRLAAEKGCPALAMREEIPDELIGEPIIAFCVDPSVSRVAKRKSTARPARSPKAGVAAAVGAPPAGEEHIVTSVANGNAYFDLGLRNGLRTGVRVDVLRHDGKLVTALVTDLCGEVICRAPVPAGLAEVVVPGMRVQMAAGEK